MKAKELKWYGNGNYGDDGVCAHAFTLDDVSVEFYIMNVYGLYELGLCQSLRKDETCIFIKSGFKTIEEAKPTAQNYFDTFVEGLLNNES